MEETCSYQLNQAGWAFIERQKQHSTNTSNARENKSRMPHQHVVGDKVLLEKPGMLPKMVAPRTGPHKLVSVNDNGTVTLQKNNVVKQTVNIRHMQPYHSRQTKH